MPEPKKKKKRNYANAYTRRGEGLAAAISSMAPAAADLVLEAIKEDIEVPKKQKTKRKPKAEPALEGEAVQIKQEAVLEARPFCLPPEAFLYSFSPCESFNLKAQSKSIAEGHELKDVFVIWKARFDASDPGWYVSAVIGSYFD